MARLHVEKTFETYTGGTTYRDRIDGMYYLNEDYNDCLNHFFSALERYRIGSGRLDDIIVKAAEIEKSRIYKTENYYDDARKKQ